MATKFSDFTAQAATGTTFVVGYDGTTNTRYTQDQLTNFVLNGDLTANANVGLATYNLGFTNGKVGVGLASPLYTFETRATVAGNWVARIMNESGTGYGLLVRANNASSNITFATHNGNGYTTAFHGTGQVGIGTATSTPSARLHVKGAGTSNATTAFLVEDSSGNDIIKVLDNRTVRIGYNANQITTESGVGGIVKLNNTSGDPLFSASVIAGSTAKINVYGGYYRTFEYGANTGLVFTNQAGFHVAQDASSMLTCISSTKGMLPPRMTTAQRDAINSGTFTTGLTLYNTTTNKLQFYNGSAWQDAAGGDNIYTADGTIGASRVATITDFPKFSGDQANPIGLEIENSRAGTNQSTHGAQLKLTARAGASSTISFYNGLGGGTSAPAMVIDSPAGIRYTGGSTYVNYHHSFNRGGAQPWYIGMANSPLTTNSPKLEMLLGGGGSNASFYTTKINGSSDFLYMFMSPGTAARHIALGEYTNSTTTYKDFLRINSTGDIGINQDTPTAKLHVTGSGATSSTTSFLVENSSGHDILKATDDGDFTISTAAKLSANFSGLYNAIYYKNSGGTTIGAFGIHSASSGLFDVRSSGNNRVRISADSGIVVDLASGGNWDTKACLTLNSTTQGMLPPRMTNTQRDAISSPTTGLTLYSTTDNKLQFYNGSAWTDAGGGGDSIYTADGTLSSARTVTVPNGGSITFSSGPANQNNLFSFNIDSIYIANTGTIRVPINGQFSINSYSTKLYQNYLQLYGAAKINGTSGGFVTVSNTTGTSYSINARLGVVGKSTTSTTDYAFRVQQSDNTDLFTLRDDGAFTLGKGASTTTASGIAIGAAASSTGASGIAIGAMTSHVTTAGQHSIAIGGSTRAAGNYSIAIGYNCGDNSTSVNSCVNIGNSAQGDGANSITLSASNSGDVGPSTSNAFGVYMSSHSTPDFTVVHDGNSYITGTGNFGVGLTNPTDRIQAPTTIGVIGDGVNAGKLKLYCEAGTAHHVAIEGPAHSGGSTYTIKLPASAPSAGQVLASDASGNLSWKSPHQLDFSGLPTSDPGQEGKLYRDSEGLIYVSIP